MSSFQSRAWVFALGLSLGLSACDVGPAVSDAGPGDRDAAAPEGNFEIELAHRDAPLLSGGELAVEFGCQGGAHVELDVRARADEPLRGAIMHIELRAGPAPVDTTLRLDATDDGAEALDVIAVFGNFSTFVSPADFTFPSAATLRVTVTAADGSAVALERAVTLTRGGGCECVYGEPIEGTAVIDAIVSRGEGSGCDPVDVELAVTFAPDGGAHIFNERTEHAFTWPAACVEALALEVGATLRLALRDSFPGQPCDPGSVFEGPSQDDIACACPPD